MDSESTYRARNHLVGEDVVTKAIRNFDLKDETSDEIEKIANTLALFTVREKWYEDAGEGRVLILSFTRTRVMAFNLIADCQ